MLLVRLAGISYSSGIIVQIDALIVATDRTYDDGVGYAYDPGQSFADNMDDLKALVASTASTATSHSYTAGDVSIL